MAYQSEVEKLEKQHQTNPDQYFAPLADAYRKAGNIDLAIELVRAGLTKRPNYLSAHIVLGRCLLDQKSDLEAGKAFERVLELDAENIIALRYLGEITERSGDLAGAQRWLRRLVDVDPTNDDAVEALKRIEAAVPARSEEVAPAAEPPEPAPAEVESVSGFEATSMDAPAEPVVASGGGDDFAIEQSSSPFESPESGGTGMSGLELESGEISLEDQPASGGASIELPASSEMQMVDLDQAARASAETTMPPVPESTEPPMLSFDDSPPPPPAAPLPEPIADAPPEEPAPTPRKSRKSITAAAPASDLPLIMPDDVEAAPPARRSAASVASVSDGMEPEPVITETMAEVYLKQGLFIEARDVYRKLVQRRPGDTGLRDKLAAVESQAASPPRGVPSVTPAGQKPRFAGPEPGGQSARSLFGKVLSARPGAPPPAPPPAPATFQAGSQAPTTMDALFGDEPASTGAPTRPTSDELSLAEVFGEEPTEAQSKPAPAPPSPAGEPGAAGGTFSFDEFFGGKGAGAPAPAAKPADTASAGAEPEGASPDDFVSWLKGLKS